MQLNSAQVLSRTCAMARSRASLLASQCCSILRSMFCRKPQPMSDAEGLRVAADARDQGDVLFSTPHHSLSPALLAVDGVLQPANRLLGDMRQVKSMEDKVHVGSQVAPDSVPPGYPAARPCKAWPNKNELASSGAAHEWCWNH